MINFFRKIRQHLAGGGKPLKYFWYAIGEIVLVVIGILIALAINNWNEKRKVIAYEKDSIRGVYHDLKNDIRKIADSRRRLSDQLTTSVEVLNAIEHGILTSEDSSRVATSIAWDISQIIPVERERSIWDELRIRESEIHLMGDSLKAEIDQFYTSFDLQIERFNQLPKDVRQDLRRISALCHTSESILSIHENGVNTYGASSAILRHCILSNEKAYALVGAIAMSCIVNISIYDTLQERAEVLLSEMEAQFEFL